MAGILLKSENDMLKKSVSFKISLLVALAIVLSGVCFAKEDPKIDSLLKVLKTQNEDTSKVNVLNALSTQFLLSKNITDAKKYAAEALLLAENKDFKNGIVKANIILGNISVRQGNNCYDLDNLPEALENYLIALKIFEKNEADKEIAKTRRNIGMVYWYLGNYSEALNNHLISLSVYEKNKDKKAVAVAYNDIGNIYETEGNSVEALKNYLAGLKICNEAGDKKSMINRLFNIGFLYDGQGDYSSALKSFSDALEISKEIGSKEGIAACAINKADTYMHQGNAERDLQKRNILFNEALINYALSSKMQWELNDKQGLAICYNGMGGAFLGLKNFSKARQFLNEGLSIFKKMTAVEFTEPSFKQPSEYIRDNYQLLARLDSATGNWKGAFGNYKLFLAYRDSLANSIANEETTKKTTSAQMQYEFDKKEDSLKY